MKRNAQNLPVEAWVIGRPNLSIWRSDRWTAAGNAREGQRFADPVMAFDQAMRLFERVNLYRIDLSTDAIVSAIPVCRTGIGLRHQDMVDRWEAEVRSAFPRQLLGRLPDSRACGFLLRHEALGFWAGSQWSAGDPHAALCFSSPEKAFLAGRQLRLEHPGASFRLEILDRNQSEIAYGLPIDLDRTPRALQQVWQAVFDEAMPDSLNCNPSTSQRPPHQHEDLALVEPACHPTPDARDYP